ncbi:uncharacterized protein LOC118410068 [Branchiostoma floridae]|uniref:Uncharacterized protein LOC118410068 n=1 Tax=Branchiostoma floridae TaxID=7739 RepID=C3Z8S9_BRAFL|nr:uncharacterized protein LOC118410068 [Branchiostoma floridae]|eukprot:XP_002595017.1 hypothetical protein BRAFLDRAFT_99637 [Branchiostoma floridae]
MDSDFRVALAWVILHVPLLYLVAAVLGGLWDDNVHFYRLLKLTKWICLSVLMEAPVLVCPSNHIAVVAARVLNQGFLCALFFLVHYIREKREPPMSLRHRVCYALLVENCAAYSLTWNYVQTAMLAGALLAEDFGAGPQAVWFLHLVLLVICALFIASVELIYPCTYQWTVAAHLPIQIWVYYLYQYSAIDGKTVCALTAFDALLLLCKIFAPEKGTEYSTISQEEDQGEDMDLKSSVV